MSSSPGSGRAVGAHYGGDLRQALIDAAAEALGEVGVDQVSLRDVARRVGVSHAAPAHHFGDKRGLLTAVAAQGFGQFVEDLAEAAASSGAAFEVLVAMGEAYVTFAERRPGYFAVMFDAACVDVDDPAYLAASNAAFAALSATIARLQRAGWRRGHDTNSLAVATWAIAHGVAVLHSQGSLARHLGRADADVVRGVVAGLLGSPR